MKRRHKVDHLIKDIKRRTIESSSSFIVTPNKQMSSKHFSSYDTTKFVTSGSDVKINTANIRPRVQQINQDTYAIATIQAGERNQNCNHCNSRIAKPRKNNYWKSSVDPEKLLSGYIKVKPLPHLKQPGLNVTNVGKREVASEKDKKALQLSSIPKPFISVSGKQMRLFLKLLDEPLVKKFLHYDICLRVSDKYLIAMAFAYFARADYQPHEYTRINFFVALYLAHDVEEDEEDYKYEIFPWALGKLWRVRYKSLLCMRDTLWKKMDYRAIVSRRCCEEIFAIEPNHSVWKRNRKEHHAGAIRPWLKDANDDGRLIGPDGSPRHCKLCNDPPKASGSDHDSLSPNSDCLWLKMDSSCSSLEEYAAQTDASFSAAGFNMNELHQTLLCSSGHTNSSGKGLSLLSGDMTLDWVDCNSDSENIIHRPEA